MVKPIIKDSSDLSLEELNELNEICRSINSHFPEDHVQENHIKKTNPIFYLFKEEGRILAFHSFSIFKEKTPFYKKEIPVIYINLSFKKQNAAASIKNYAKWSNAHFLKENIGRFWYFKKFALIFLTNNPKLAERSSKVFYESYPSYKGDTSEDVQAFCSNFVFKNLKIVDSKINHNLVLEKRIPYKMDISSNWEKLYKASDSEQNNFFLKEEVLSSEKNKLFLTGNLMLFMGHNSFLNLIKNTFQIKSNQYKNPYKVSRFYTL
jgi:hypothetical protein